MLATTTPPAHSSATSVPAAADQRITTLLLPELERLDVDAGRAGRVLHVRPDALRLRRDVTLGHPGRSLRHLRVFELIEGQIGRRARHGAEATAADHTGHLLVVRDVDRVVPAVEVGVDRG